MIEPRRSIKNVAVEPSLYALILEGNDKAMIHIGVHFTLDEAVAVATPELQGLLKEDGKELTNAHLGMWSSMKARDVLNAMVVQRPDNKPLPSEEITPDEQIKNLKASKNILMKSLIERKDFIGVSKARNILTKAEKKYILDKIDDNSEQQKRA